MGGGGSATVGGSAALAANTGGGLTFAGTGATTLSGSNNYSGVTSITAGTLTLANSAALYGSTFNVGGAGTLNFGTLTAATFGGLQGTAGTVTLANATPAAVALSVGASGLNNTFSGALTGSGSVLKVGVGTLVLGGTNNYSGGTQINGGVLQFTSTNAVPAGAGSVTVNTGGILAATGAYPTINAWLASGSIAASSAGAVGLASGYADTDVNFTTGAPPGSGYNSLSLGAIGAVTYGGTIEPGAGGYMLGGGGALTLQTSLTGANNVTVAGPGSVVLAAAPSYTGNTTVSGAGTLDLGGNTLSTAATVTIVSGTLQDGTINNSGSYAVQGGTVSAVLAGSAGLTKTTAASLLLTNANTYLGPTTISAGTLQLGSGAPGNDGSLATSGLTNNGTLYYNLAGGQTAAYSISGSGNLALAGGGLNLAGTNNIYTGTTNVNGGTLAISGNLNSTGEVMVGDGAGLAGVLAVAGTLVANRNANPSLDIGGVIGGVGDLRILPGASVATTSEFHLGGNGSGTGGFGAATVTGGNFSIGSWFLIPGGGQGIFNQSGGTVSQTSQNTVVACLGSSNMGVANFSGSANFNTVGTLYLMQNTGAGDNAIVNISGSASVTAVTNVQFGGNGSNSGDNGILNLNGGTLATKQVLNGGNTNAGSTWLLNFNGGTLRAYSGASAAFMTIAGNSSAYVYSGGGTIDNNGQAITIGQSLLAPSGSGVSTNTSGLSFGGANSGYIDTPVVLVTGGSGSGATAVATVTGGQVTGIQITNPGTGYIGSPTFTLYGGGGSATVNGTVPLAANGAPPGSGGLTFVGTGTTTLSGTNTYTGPTVVTAGTLLATQTASLPNYGAAGLLAVASSATLEVPARRRPELDRGQHQLPAQRGGQLRRRIGLRGERGHRHFLLLCQRPRRQPARQELHHGRSRDVHFDRVEQLYWHDDDLRRHAAIGHRRARQRRLAGHQRDCQQQHALLQPGRQPDRQLRHQRHGQRDGDGRPVDPQRQHRRRKQRYADQRRLDLGRNQ